ncbi:hypothetical protein V8G54_001436 [Vigna mungo]|uniref:Uncharacterized protein n=1 Tax=Vigna mungo TaxID=3915 RepID=A0AAQ3S9X6_VIGMU
MERTASSSSLASSHGTPVEVKPETLKSLIDFDDDPEPSVAPAIPQAHQTAVAELGMPANSNDNNWASFDFAPEAKTPHGPSNVNPLESMLTQLTGPVSLPSQVSQAQGDPHVTMPIRRRLMTKLLFSDSSFLLQDL